MTNVSAHSQRHSVPSLTIVPVQWSAWPAALGLAVVAVLIYLPSLRFGFVGWDDTRYITDSPLMTQPGGLERIWFSGEAEQYYPLTFTSYWFEFCLWKDRPAGYHAVNVALHAANTVLLLLFLRRLGLSRWTACAVCLLFAVHPMQVQSVAWVAERKNLLSCVFVLLSLIAWCRFRQRTEPWGYVLSLAAFVVALLSKTAVLTFPLVLAAMDRWVWKLSWRRIVPAVTPFLVPAAVLAFITIAFERTFTGRVPDLTVRPLIASAALGFYVIQLVAPIHLLPMHPQWDVSTDSIAWWLPTAALLGVAVMLWRIRYRLDGIVAYGVIHFVVFLLPVLGLIGYGNLALTYVSDHYLYLPSIGFFLVIVFALERLCDRLPDFRMWITGIGAAALVAATVMTTCYLPTFANGEAMWSRTLTGNPKCPAAHAGLGRVYEDRRLWDQALEHYQRAAELAPHMEAYLDIARILRRLSRSEEAVGVLMSVRNAYPQTTEPIVELGRMAQQARQFDHAEQWFREALAVNPRNAFIHVELAALYLGLSRGEEAETHFREAVTLEPRNARAYLGLATSLRGLQRFEDSVKALRAGLQVLPRDVSLLNLLARILATCPDDRVRNSSQAVALSERADAITHHVDYEVLDTLAAAYAEAGRWAEAVQAAGDAIGLAQSAEDAVFVDALRRRQEQYRNHEPLREVTTTVHRGR